MDGERNAQRIVRLARLGILTRQGETALARPITVWSSSSASGVPRRMVMARTEPTSTRVFCSEVRNAGSVRKYRKFSSPTKLSLPGSSRL